MRALGAQDWTMLRNLPGTFCFGRRGGNESNKLLKTPFFFFFSSSVIDMWQEGKENS